MSSTVPSKYTDDSFQTIYPNKSQKLSFTNTSGAATNPVALTTNLVLLFATQNCWVRFAANPVAAASDGDSFYLPANMHLAVGITPGHKIAAIRDSANGDLHIIEGA